MTPDHYLGDGEITCEDAMRSMTADADGVPPMEAKWWTDAFKYLWRWPHKGQAISDLGKARDCIDWDSCDEADPPSCSYCPNCGRKVVIE